MAENKVTYLCVVRLLLDSTTVLEGLFGEYHSSSAALGKQRLGVTKQPPFGDWGGSSNTRMSLMCKRDGGCRSTALSPTSLRGQGMGFIV